MTNVLSRKSLDIRAFSLRLEVLWIIENSILAPLCNPRFEEYLNDKSLRPSRNHPDIIPSGYVKIVDFPTKNCDFP